MHRVFLPIIGNSDACCTEDNILTRAANKRVVHFLSQAQAGGMTIVSSTVSQKFYRGLHD